MNHQFHIHHAEFQSLLDESIDWLINSWKFKRGSLEWKVCQLKREIYMRDALTELRKANLCLKEKN